MNTWVAQMFEYWKSGGPLLIAIAFVCMGIWAFFLRSHEVLTRILREGTAVENALDREMLGENAASLSAGLSVLPGGVAAIIRAAVDDVLRGALPREAFIAHESECMGLLKHDLIVLTTLTAVAPLLGLLGTVMGMIQTFEAVAAIAGNTGSRVAAGISKALITTQFGLVVALPGVFMIARLKRMLRNTQVVMAECRAHALQTLEHGKEEIEP
jgi:biopolymer transport protein ExbB